MSNTTINRKGVVNMHTLIRSCLLIFLLGLYSAAFADEEEKSPPGVEVSREHKSDQGLEHGKAYAGSKEKKEKKETSAKDDNGDEEGEEIEAEKDDEGKKEKKSKKEK
jgi:hypothetical protein